MASKRIATNKMQLTRFHYKKTISEEATWMIYKNHQAIQERLYSVPLPSIKLLPALEKMSISFAETVEAKFNRLAQQWFEETAIHSNIDKIAMHPAYQKIIGMGKDALPFILHDLQKTSNHWLWALHAITEEDPTPEGSNYQKAIECWLQWGHEHGYL